jgi:hypothetical protein
MQANAHAAQTVFADHFENDGGWVLETRDGAEGALQYDDTHARSGSRSLRLEKHNGMGAVVLRTAEPVEVPSGGRWFFRLSFHAQNAPVNSMLLLRASEDHHDVRYDATDRSAGYSGHSLLINSPDGQWTNRAMSFQGTPGQQVYLMVVLWGNPTSVLIDDVQLSLDPAPWGNEVRTEYPPRRSRDHVLERLAERQAASARVQADGARQRLLIDGELVEPVIYKSALGFGGVADFAAFGEAGTPLATVPVFLGTAYNQPGVWRGPGDFDFTAATRAIEEALRRNLNAHLILEIMVTPYVGWGEAHPDEVWRSIDGRYAFGTWGDIEGYVDRPEELEALNRDGRKRWLIPSYHSLVWREQAADAMTALIEHLRPTPQFKPVVGFMFTGGQDGQWVSDFAIDFALPSLQGYRAHLREQYNTIEQLNQAWETNYAQWDDIDLPRDPLATAATEDAPLYAVPNVTAVRRMNALNAWRLRDAFSEAVKAAAGKDVVTMAYAGRDPMFVLPDFLKTRSLDATTYMTYYPYRNAGYATGFLVPRIPRDQPKLFIQELDLRSWVGASYDDEVYQTWIGAGRDAPQWDALHRRLVGMSLATGSGYWYYDMGRYFHDPAIHESVARVTPVARRQLLPAAPPAWRPDVLVVLGDPDPREYRGPLYNTVNLTKHHQNMHLQTSGVPYEAAFLSDVLSDPQLQDRKVYVFYTTLKITTEQRAAIEEKLKGEDRTLVWLYDSGHITERGPDLQALSQLVGINLATSSAYERSVVSVHVDGHPLVKGALPYQGVSEMMSAMMALTGSNPLIAGAPMFWIDDAEATQLAIYAGSERVAMATRKHAGWTSVHIASPNSLGGDLLHNIAREAGAYVLTDPGHEIWMNDRFISLHAMRSGEVRLHPPNGARFVDTAGNELAQNGQGDVLLQVEAQQTYWLERIDGAPASVEPRPSP